MVPRPPDAPASSDAREAVLALLDARAADATICPSEAARLCDPTHWRDAMPAVHDAVDQLLAEGRVMLSWKGGPLTTRAGPYRIAAVTPMPLDTSPKS